LEIVANESQRRNALEKLVRAQEILGILEKRTKNDATWKDSDDAWVQYYGEMSDNQLFKAYVAGQLLYDKLDEISKKEPRLTNEEIISKKLIEKTYIENVLIEGFRFDLDKEKMYDTDVYLAMIKGYGNDLSEQAQTILGQTIVDSRFLEIERNKQRENSTRNILTDILRDHF